MCILLQDTIIADNLWKLRESTFSGFMSIHLEELITNSRKSPTTVISFFHKRSFKNCKKKLHSFDIQQPSLHLVSGLDTASFTVF